MGCADVGCWIDKVRKETFCTWKEVGDVLKMKNIMVNCDTKELRG